MKIATITGQTSRDSLRCFKPVNKIFIVKKYSKFGTDNMVKNEDEKDINIRIRLVNDTLGNSIELVPKMSLNLLSDIASKGEGFQRRAIRRQTTPPTEQFDYLDGDSINSIIVGALLDTGDYAAVDLSNNKYLDISLENLDERVTYEVYGFEHQVSSKFFRTYSTLFLPAGELNKSISIGSNELLALPMNLVDEIQLYPKSSEHGSPTYTQSELRFEAYTQNDLATVGLTAGGKCLTETLDGRSFVLPINFGALNWVLLPVSDFKNFDIRRNENGEPLMLLLIDTKE